MILYCKQQALGEGVRGWGGEEGKVRGEEGEEGEGDEGEEGEEGERVRKVKRVLWEVNAFLEITFWELGFLEFSWF